MTNEDMSIDVDDFVDSGIEEAGEKLEKQLEEEGSILSPEDHPAKETEPESAAEETPAATETPESEAKTEPEAKETPDQTDSTISQLIEQPAQEQRVPVEDHIKLRKRAQTAEKELAELKAQQHTTTPAGENAEEVDPLAELDETDLVRVSDVKEYVGKKVEQAVGQVQQTIEQKEAAVREAKAVATKAVKSEQEIIKTTTDYNTVTKAALKLGLLSAEEKAEISAADNPAQEFYKRSKAKLTDIQTALGITPTSTGKQQQTEETAVVPEDEEIPSDDEVLEVFGN